MTAPCHHSGSLSRTATPLAQPEPEAPILDTISSKLIVVGNVLRRGAILRYRSLVGLPWVEYGIVAVLGRRAPVTVNKLAELLGMDKAQLSRALSNLVKRKLVLRSANPQDSREVLIALSPAGLCTHDLIVRGGIESNARLLEEISAEDVSSLDRLLDQLTARAMKMLRDEQGQGGADEPAGA